MRDEAFKYLPAEVSGEEFFEYAFFKGDSPSVIDKRVSVLENAKLRVLLFDLAPRDITLNLKIDALTGSEVEVYIATYADSEFKKNFNVSIENRGASSKSFVKMYGIVASKALLNFDGSTKIVKGACRSKVRQEAKIISFSKEATCIANPRLLIDENDIEASHGATIGSIPSLSLFYLMSRGLSKDEVMMLVARGSFKPILNLYQDEELKALIDRSLDGVIVK